MALTICPKCQMVRPETTQVPAWQCPGCGIAYVKASEASGSTATMRQQPVYGRSNHSEGVRWGKWLTIAAILWGAYVGLQGVEKRKLLRTEGVSSMASRMGATPTEEQLKALAASTQPEDVLMYSAEWCPNCTQAKHWMDQYGFKYQICDIDKGAGCKQQLQSLGSEGVPYLIVKGHHIKDGFDSEEFIAALSTP